MVDTTSMKPSSRVALLCLGLFSGTSPAQNIVGLGAIPNSARSTAQNLSDDCSVIGGTWYEFNAHGKSIPCRWIRNADGTYERETLGHLLPEDSSFVYSMVSGDGSTIFTASFREGLQRSYLVQALPAGGYVVDALTSRTYAEGFYPMALNVIGDVLVGGASVGEETRAFVWTHPSEGLEGFEYFDLPPGVSESRPWSMSRDGRVIVGDYFVGEQFPFRAVPAVWTDGVVRSLEVPAGFDEASASAVSDDGRTIVGYATESWRTAIPFLWRDEQPPVMLGLLPRTVRAFPYSVSADGSVVVGWSRDARDIGYIDRPFLWTRRTGMLDLNALVQQFAIEPDEWRVLSPRAISADGRTILCTGKHFGEGESFVVTLPEWCTADFDNDGDAANGGMPDFAVGIEDLIYFLNRFEVGDPRLDLDDGTGTGLGDDAVDVADLLYFLARFEEGC